MSAPISVFSKPCVGGCGMPLYWNQLPGTERDESKRGDYCAECERLARLDNDSNRNE